MSPTPCRILSVLGATSLVAVGSLAPAACKPRDCTLLGCDSAHARITLHVPVPPAQLGASKITVCWRDVCSDLVGASDAGTSDAGTSDAGTPIAFDTRTSLLLGEAAVWAEAAGVSRVELTLRYFTRGTRGDFVHMRPADGDLYRVTVTDAAGVKLFAAERVVTYTESYPNGTDCDPDPCRQATFDLPAP